MKKCGLILWNVTAVCDMSKTYWAVGNTLYERRFAETCKVPVVPFDAVVNIIRVRRKTSQGSINLVGQFLPGVCAWICNAMYAGEFGMEIFRSQTLTSWTFWTRSPRSKTQRKGNNNAEKWWLKSGID